MGDGPVLTIRRDARFECEQAVAECREEEGRFLLTHGLDMRDSVIKATLTEREAVSLMAVLQAAISYLRGQTTRKVG